MMLIFVAMTASLFVWLFSRFNKYPNYASRAIIGFSIGMFIINFPTRELFSALGPMTIGHSSKRHVFMFTFSFGVLSWIYFASSRFFRFRSKRKNEELKGTPKAPKFIELEKVSTAAFLNRRVNKGFLLFLLGFALFDPVFWPGSDLWASSSTTLSIFLQTLATYLFVAYFVITLQLRAVRRLDFLDCYGGYIPPYYIYGLAVVGTFCAAVFAFVPFDYMGRENHVLQAIAPFVYFGISLFRTGKQYYSRIKTTEHMVQTGVVFNTKKSLVFYFSIVVVISMVGIMYMHSYGHNVSYNSEDIRVSIDKALPLEFEPKENIGFFRDITEFTLLGNIKTDKRSDRIEKRFVMKVLTKIPVRRNKHQSRLRYTTLKETIVAIKGNIAYRKRTNDLFLKDVEFVRMSFDDDSFTKDELRRAKSNIRRAIRRHFGNERLYPLPEIFFPLIDQVKFDDGEIKMQLKLG
jgi:hypothetical protein